MRGILGSVRIAGLAIAASSIAGCGSTLWFITPRPEVTHYEITRITQIEVTTTPPGATVYVDGAEAGITPRSVPVAFKEIRRQRRQATWPAIVGTAIDMTLGILGTVIALENDAPEAAALIAGAASGLVLLDLHLITGRSVVNEGVDIVSMPVEIGVRAPGFVDAARRVRVPDFEKLQFQLVPGAPTTTQPPPAAPPPPVASPPPVAPPPPGAALPPHRR